jgi:hypothetical protein
MPNPAPAFEQPHAVERWFGWVLIFLVRIGLVRGHFYVLEVRGRKSGKTISLPVDPLDLDGKRYLVSPRGQSNWVSNARTAGEVVLAHALRRQRYKLRELPPDIRPPILKAYLDRYAGEVQRFFPVAKGSPPEAFAELASRYPVFELEPLEDGVSVYRRSQGGNSSSGSLTHTNGIPCRSAQSTTKRNSTATEFSGRLWSITLSPWAKHQLPTTSSGLSALRSTLNSMYRAAPASDFSSMIATTAYS